MTFMLTPNAENKIDLFIKGPQLNGVQEHNPAKPAFRVNEYVFQKISTVITWNIQRNFQ